MRAFLKYLKKIVAKNKVHEEAEAVRYRETAEAEYAAKMKELRASLDRSEARLERRLVTHGNGH